MSPRPSNERGLDRYFDSIRRLPLLTAEEEKACALRWREGDPEGLRALVEGNLRFVVREANKFKGLGLELPDLVAEGNVGLLEAAKRFDPDRETRFLTYAAWWVRQAIFQALAKHASPVHLPGKVACRQAQLFRTLQKLEQALGRKPTPEELQAALPTFTPAELDFLQMLHWTFDILSTEQVVAGEDRTLGDCLEQNVEPNPLAALDHATFHEQMRQSLAALDPKERRVLELHFGLNGHEPLSFEATGRAMEPPISRERVRQLEVRAFEKLRSRRKDLLKPYLEGDRP